MSALKLDIKPKELLGMSFSDGQGNLPINLNHNDKSSLFAGSIFSCAILTAYYASQDVFAALGLSGELVAKRSDIRFLAPIYADGKAELIQHTEPERKSNGNYQLHCEVQVSDQAGRQCAVLEVDFILMTAA